LCRDAAFPDAAFAGEHEDDVADFVEWHGGRSVWCAGWRWRLGYGGVVRVAHGVGEDVWRRFEIIVGRSGGGRDRRSGLPWQRLF
jgi:hypothetical protein